MPGIINDPAVALYVVAGVALIVMAGFFVYLWSMDRRVRELRQMIERADGGSSAEPRLRGIESEPLRAQRVEKGA